MEENKEEKVVEAEVIKENDNSNKKIDVNKIVEFIKAKKKIILIAIIAIIVIIIAIDLIFLSPKEVVQKFVKSLDSKNSEKAFGYISLAGSEVFSDLDDDEYDDFWSEYKDFKDSDDYQDLIDEMDEYMEDIDFDELDDMLDDYDISIKIEKINKVKKVSSHLYKVSVKLEISADDEEESGTVYFYVMKEGTKSYLVGMDSNSVSSLFSIF